MESDALVPSAKRSVMVTVPAEAGMIQMPSHWSRVLRCMHSTLASPPTSIFGSFAMLAAVNSAYDPSSGQLHATVEAAGGVSAAVNIVHPAEAEDVVGLASAMRSIRRRFAAVRAALLALLRP